MDIMTAKNLITKLVEAGDNETVIKLVGPPGVGKSAIFHQIKADMEKKTGKPFGFIAVHLSAYDAPDVQGFGVPTKTADGMKMVFTPPAFFPWGDAPEHGILLLDEWGQADTDTQKPLARLVEERRIGQHTLPEGWHIYLASNREKDRSGVNREMAMMSNRICEVPIEPSLDAWIKWAVAAGVSPVGVAFAKFKPGVVFTEEVPDEPGPFATPRTLVKTLNALSHVDDEYIATEIAMGYMGRGAGTELMAFLKVANSVPDYEEIIADPTTAPVPDDDNIGAQWAVSQMIAYRVTEKEAVKAFKYLLRLPKDFQTSALYSAIVRNPALATNKEFGDWMAENSSLVMTAYSVAG